MAGVGWEGRLVDVDTGMLRPGRVLLQRTPAAVLFLGFGAPAARLRDLAFDGDAELDPAARRCRSLAAARDARLKVGDMGAAFAKPAADDQAYRRLAVVEDLAKAGFDPSEPRIPKGNEHPGRWTREGGGEAETPVSIRPGHYIDELADFVEWIANAKPEDEKPIRREIKRLYYDVGDVQGGNALNAALSDTIDPGIPQSDRQAILDGISAYAIADPAEMGQFSAALAGTVLAAQAPALRGRPRAASPAAGPPAVAAATAAAEEAAATAVRAERPSEVWNYGWAARGDAIHEAMGANLQRSWKTIDDFRDGVATSIKSIDLSARTYRDPKRLAARINKFVDWIVEYPGSELSDVRITAKEITSRRLQLVVPRGTATARQQSAITVSTLRAQTFGVKLVITPY